MGEVLTDVTGTVPAAPTGGIPWTEQKGQPENATYDIVFDGTCTSSTDVEADLVPPFVSITTTGSNGNDINLQGENQ